MVVVAVAGFLTIAWVAARQSGKLREEVGHSNETLACYVLPQIDRSFKSLPTIAYYREHPDELTTAKAQLREQRTKAVEAWGTCPT